MLTLYLLRHAKSSWDREDLSDLERPLSARGKDAAPRMGRFMRARGYRPELILCSPAQRTRDTLKLAFPKSPEVCEVRIVEGLYNFGDGTGLIDIVAREAGSHESVLVIGHNPSTESAATRLSGTSCSDDCRRMAHKFPTCSLAVIEFDMTSWHDIADGKGKLISFTRPKDLVSAV